MTIFILAQAVFNGLFAGWLMSEALQNLMR